MPTIEPLNDSELTWIKEQLAGASRFVAEFSPADASQPLSLAALDRAFSAWLNRPSQRPDASAINSVINQVGTAFGQALVDGIGFTWVIATDEHGTEVAVHAFPGRGDVLVYPANFVAKRWERRETSFLEDAYQRIAKDARNVFRQWHNSDSV